MGQLAHETWTVSLETTRTSLFARTLGLASHANTGVSFHVPCSIVATTGTATGLRLYACGVSRDTTTSSSSSSYSSNILPNHRPSACPVNGRPVLEQLHVSFRSHHTHLCYVAPCYVIQGRFFLYVLGVCVCVWLIVPGEGKNGGIEQEFKEWEIET